MARNVYRYELLSVHMNEIVAETRRTLKKEVMEARKAFTFLDKHFHSIEKFPKGLVRNVKMLLTTRFTNHLLSTLMLAERGLVLDAINCSRSALETTAFYWLVCHDPSSANSYDGEKSVPPVEIRKKLESLGVDVQAIRALYGQESSIAHVGNKSDQVQIRWERGTNGALLVGGGMVPEMQRAIFEGIVRAVFRFVKFEPCYQPVPDLDDPVVWKDGGVKVGYPEIK